MSSATATANGAAPVKSGKKKLIIIVAVALVLLLVLAGGAVLLLKKKAQDAEDAAGDEEVVTEHASASHTRDPGVVPTFVPLDMFTVNLADRDTDRYAQVGITLELGDAHEADTLKTFMPAVRNNILMVLAHKTAAELLEREGKTQLAAEIRTETARAMGIEVDTADEGDASVKAKKRKKRGPENPVAAVYFSNFIIQ